MNFQFPSLLGPGYLVLYAAVALPILIHLINMLRHRRVEWAAMEFLLASHKKNRTWVRLKQLLLLLLRIAALATVAFLAAQPLMNNEMARLFGSARTHHIVLLDDSFSMSDHWALTTAFDEAKRGIERLGKAASEQVEAQQFTLLRFSRVGRAQPDLLQEDVDREEFVATLGRKLEKINSAPVPASPLAALREIEQLSSDDTGERRIVYIFSDFRARDWNDPGEVRNILADLTKQNVELHLVNCVDRGRPNVAITRLTPAEGIQAAEVPFHMEVTVQNFGKDMLRDVRVLLEEEEEDKRSHAWPSITIPSVAGGQAVTQTFPVNFTRAGDHQLTAKLEDDAVAVDNVRYAVLNVPADVPVLLVDGDPNALDARYVGFACAPGGSVRTGLKPLIENPRYLSAKPLDRFQAISLFNIDHIDQSGIEAVERFLEGGGGVAVFLGERSQPKFVNEQLYRDGKGFFPLPLRTATELPVDRLERAPDVNPGEHFIFERGLRDPFVSMMTVQRYFAVPDSWKPDPESTVEVIARLRNGAPLAVARSFGKGRVIAFLTSAAPASSRTGPMWNNWARTPSFVVMMQDLQAFLAHRATGDVSRLVGSPLAVPFDPAQYRAGVLFYTPAGESPSGTVDATPGPGGQLTSTFTATDAPGIYRAVLAGAQAGNADPQASKGETATSNETTRRFAFNVDAAEGDLAVISKTDLASRLDGVKYLFEQVDMFQYSAGEMAGYNLSQFLLLFLILLLLGEQFVAWSAGYHPAARAAKGGAQ